MSAAIRVLLVDDHAIVVDGLARLMAEFPGITVVGIATTGKGALLAVEEHAPDVVVLDQQLPDESGLGLVGRIRSRHPKTAVLMLSGALDQMLEEDALALGCAVALNKSAPVDEVVAGVRVAAATVGVTADTNPRVGRLGLTPREMDVLLCIVRGLSSKEMSTELHLSHHTVRNYTQRVLDKLDVRSKAEAVAIAAQHGLVHDGLRGN